MTPLEKQFHKYRLSDVDEESIADALKVQSFTGEKSIKRIKFPQVTKPVITIKNKHEFKRENKD